MTDLRVQVQVRMRAHALELPEATTRDGRIDRQDPALRIDDRQRM